MSNALERKSKSKRILFELQAPGQGHYMGLFVVGPINPLQPNFMRLAVEVEVRI